MRSIPSADVLLKHEPTNAYLGAGFVLTDRAGALVLTDRSSAAALLARHAPLPGFVVVATDVEHDDEAAA
jgi:hypothetical protein